MHPPDHDKQRTYYIGWNHGYIVSNVICFAHDGTVPCTYLNCPGPLHDSNYNVARQVSLYNNLKMVYEAAKEIFIYD